MREALSSWVGTGSKAARDLGQLLVPPHPCARGCSASPSKHLVRAPTAVLLVESEVTCQL